MKNQFMEMGTRIQNRRKELLIKQAELAELLDISPNHMSSIETGKQRPSMDIFLAICEELKVTPDYLLLGNMYANNIPQDIADCMRLCSDEDILLMRNIVEHLVKRNSTDWNTKNFT